MKLADSLIGVLAGVALTACSSAQVKPSETTTSSSPSAAAPAKKAAPVDTRDPKRYERSIAGKLWASAAYESAIQAPPAGQPGFDELVERQGKVELTITKAVKGQGEFAELLKKGETLAEPDKADAVIELTVGPEVPNTRTAQQTLTAQVKSGKRSIPNPTYEKQQQAVADAKKRVDTSQASLDSAMKVKYIDAKARTQAIGGYEQTVRNNAKQLELQQKKLSDTPATKEIDNLVDVPYTASVTTVSCARHVSYTVTSRYLKEPIKVDEDVIAQQAVEKRAAIPKANLPAVEPPVPTPASLCPSARIKANDLLKLGFARVSGAASAQLMEAAITRATGDDEKRNAVLAAFMAGSKTRDEVGKLLSLPENDLKAFEARFIDLQQTPVIKPGMVVGTDGTWEAFSGFMQPNMFANPTIQNPSTNRTLQDEGPYEGAALPSGTPAHLVSSPYGINESQRMNIVGRKKFRTTEPVTFKMTFVGETAGDNMRCVAGIDHNRGIMQATHTNPKPPPMTFDLTPGIHYAWVACAIVDGGKLAAEFR